MNNPSARNKPAPSKPPPPKPTGEEKPPAKEMGWKPPPLFQAYPQAIKHGRLPAPTLSADAILRVHAAAKGNGPSNRENLGSLSQQREHVPEANVIRKKREYREQKHIRSVSQTIAKADWTQKIFVVSTAGYILQYTGEGKYDRLPEKMLLLGPKSVAFASDAIPGKHWVLQVSQGSEPDDNTAVDTTTSTPRPLLARLGFHRSYTRRLTQSFLLVFNDPDEMSSWLLTVRAQIEARGGKKYVSERVFDDGMEHQLRSKTSVRQLVKRDPNRFSTGYPQPLNEYEDEQSLRGGSALSHQSSFVSNNRHSIVSSTTQTDVTVPPAAGSSNSSGRFYAAASAPREAPISPAVRNDPPRDEIPTFSGPKKRQSTLHISSQLPAEPQMGTPRPSRSQSPLIRSASPPAPNFSVPSFSQRFAARSGMTQIPPLQPTTSQASQYSGEGEDAYFGANAFAAFPSPPQSPQRSFSSMSRPDLNELYGGGGFVSRESSLARRPLRVSSSQDSLATTDSTAQQQQVIQIQDRRPSALTRPPRGSVSTVNSTSRPSRPISIISGSDISEAQEPPLQSSPPLQQQTYNNSHHLKGEMQIRSRRDPQRGRTSILPQSNNISSTNNTTTPTNYSSVPSVSRRKSTPGLGIGPPALPPPSCPLPKIPSPLPVDQYPSPTSSTTNINDMPGGAISPPTCVSPSPNSLLRERKDSAALGGSSSRYNYPRYSSLGTRGVPSSATRHANANIT